MNEDREERSERRSKLDQFAEAPDDSTQLVPIMPQGSVINQVFGAQAVAVKRDERQVLNKIRALAAAATSEWFYRFPVRNKKQGRTDYIEGPSIKMANDIARIYGNCDVDCRAMDAGSHIIFSARFIDLETGYSLTRPFQQRKGASSMGSDSDRQADITFQIGASKAIRNVIVNALQTYADFALDEARNALVERIGGDLENWRRRTIERLKERTEVRRVEAVIGRPSNDWTAPDVSRVITMMKAVADGMASLDETFPPLGDAHATGTASATRLDEFVSKSSSASMSPHDSGIPSPTPAAGQAGPDLSPSSGPATDLRLEAAEKIIALANDQSLPPQERLEALDLLKPSLEDRLPGFPEFVRNAIATAKDVIDGNISPPSGLKYLRSLIK